MRGHDTSPARCRLSAAVRTLAPGGIVTFTTGPRALPPHAASDAVHSARSAARRTRARQLAARPYAARLLTELRNESQRMLKKNRGGQRVDIALAAASGAAHLAHRAQSGGGGVSLIHERHGKPRSLLELGRDLSRLDRARRVVAAIIERKSDHERRCFGRLRPSHDLRDGWPLARPSHDESGRRCDGARRVAQGESHTLLAVIHRENASGIAARARSARARIA